MALELATRWAPRTKRWIVPLQRSRGTCRGQSSIDSIGPRGLAAASKELLTALVEAKRPCRAFFFLKRKRLGRGQALEIYTQLAVCDVRGPGGRRTSHIAQWNYKYQDIYIISHILIYPSVGTYITTMYGTPMKAPFHVNQLRFAQSLTELELFDCGHLQTKAQPAGNNSRRKRSSGPFTEAEIIMIVAKELSGGRHFSRDRS